MEKHVLEVKGQDDCSRAKRSELQHEGEAAARDQATQGLVHVKDLVFDLKATGCSYSVMTR